MNELLAFLTAVPRSCSKNIGARVLQCGGQYIESPVVGTVPHAQSGTLTLLVSGEEKAVKTHTDVLQVCVIVGGCDASSLCLCELWTTRTAHLHAAAIDVNVALTCVVICVCGQVFGKVQYISSSLGAAPTMKLAINQIGS